MRNWVLLRSAQAALVQARELERSIQRLSGRTELALVAERTYLQAYARELRRLVKHCEVRRLGSPSSTPTGLLRVVPEQLSLW